ncbi:MAG TPA: carboxymuconolactone decarboxylase family protein [Flavipsychrobacter sp.]|nr:carboxymuconolactone decarboxylase family protein [Flavipsychrobacter sp.]
MSAIQHETVQHFFHDLMIDAEHSSLALEKLVAADHRHIRDLKLNTNSVLNSSHLTKKEAYLLALATSVNEKNSACIPAFEKLARKEGADDNEIAEVVACVGVMSTNNIFYRFKHYLHETEFYQKQPAGLRMSVMMNPVLGKEFFELMSLAISALNGCERCVTSHEQSVKDHGASEARIFDAIRLASVIKSLCVLL